MLYTVRISKQEIKIRKILLRITASVLIVFGAFCVLTSGAAFGDIAAAIAIGGVVSILSGVGLWLVPGK